MFWRTSTKKTNLSNNRRRCFSFCGFLSSATTLWSCSRLWRQANTFHSFQWAKELKKKNQESCTQKQKTTEWKLNIYISNESMISIKLEFKLRLSWIIFGNFDLNNKALLKQHYNLLVYSQFERVLEKIGLELLQLLLWLLVLLQVFFVEALGYLNDYVSVEK